MDHLNYYKKGVPSLNWNAVYLFLKNKGYKVNSPGQHSNAATEPYITITDSGTDKFPGTRSVGFALLSIWVVYPRGRYSEIADFVEVLKNDLSELQNLKSTGYISPAVIDDEADGYNFYLEYQVLKRL